MAQIQKHIIHAHITPKSGRDILCGVEPDQNGLPLLKIKVTAPPENGKANASVEKLIAKSVGIAKSCVSVTRGTKSRYKQIEITTSEEKFLNWLKSL